MDRDDLSLSEMCGTTLNRRPICLAVVDASLYRPEVEVKAEPSAATSSSLPKETSGPRMVTAGRVTIENEEDNTPPTPTVSLFKATAPKKSSKKRKSTAVVDDSDDDDHVQPSPPKQSKSNRNSLLSSDKKKLKKKSNSSGFLETSIAESTSPQGKKNKRSNATADNDTEEHPVLVKKPKKTKKTSQ